MQFRPIEQIDQPDGSDDSVYLIFLSHKAEVKKEVQTLKVGLEEYGVEAFVAHSDIYPGTEWQEEILEALAHMDAFVPVLTKEFPDSHWTDQEVGYAVARDVPIIPLRIDTDPYGFMGKYQALSCGWEGAPREIIKALTDDQLLIDSYLGAVESCDSFDVANRLSGILPSIVGLTEEQVARFMTAFNQNIKVSNSYGFNGTWQSKYGEGLAILISGLTEQKVEIRKVGDRYQIYPASSISPWHFGGSMWPTQSF